MEKNTSNHSLQKNRLQKGLKFLMFENEGTVGIEWIGKKIPKKIGGLITKISM